MSIRSSHAPDIPDMGDDVRMVDIKQPHNHDVLCGRGVTTNRFPGNESFRSLVSLNKELYVTSTKRQKMSISRSIVEAVRSLKPPGRFLEKNPVTGLWSDIGDRKAIEKTSQALRDGAAGLRKELSEDLGDPEFLSGLFDAEANQSKDSSKPKAPSPTLKDKDKVRIVKPKIAKKGHRRVRSNPSPIGTTAIKKEIRKQKSQVSSESPISPRSALPSRPPLSPASPRSHPTSPHGAWSARYPVGRHPGHYPSEAPSSTHPGMPRYHRSHPYMTPPPHHSAPPRPVHAPHSWSHGGPPRYPGPPAPTSAVHTPNSPLPPGRHELTPSGFVSKPPPPPRINWSPRHFPPHAYFPPPEYYRPEYASRHPNHPEYRREFWHPPHHDSRDRHYYRDYHEYPDYARSDRGLDVPDLSKERDYRDVYRWDDHRSRGSPPLPPQEFSPPTTPSKRYKPAQDSNSSPQVKTPESKNGDRRRESPNEKMHETSERSTRSAVKAGKERSKDDSTQNTVMTPATESDKDTVMEDCRSPEQQEYIAKGKVRIISVVHQMDDKTGEREESIEFVLKDPKADDYSLSPLPYEQEDPSSLMELPDDILHMPISACGPHDE